jgi:hypothetical protein
MLAFIVLYLEGGVVDEVNGFEKDRATGCDNGGAAVRNISNRSLSRHCNFVIQLEVSESHSSNGGDSVFQKNKSSTA